MGTRVPVDHYDLSSAAAASNSHIGTSLHDLNSGDEVTDLAADDVADDRSSSVGSNTEQTPSKQHMQALAHQAQFHRIHQGDHHQINHSSHATHFMHSPRCVPSPQLPEIVHNQQPSAIAQHIACLQSLGHVGGRLHVMATSPAKFCHQCGYRYLREASKFCSECGTKRLGT